MPDDIQQPSHSNPMPLRLDPTFVVGMDRNGSWLAIETHGLGGGIFLDRDAATHYAEFETGHRPGSVLVSTDLVQLRF
ncbi:hypothetical protein [Lichenihabitans psoromatis]|uniref:hypothetical protein n=1 Tax=Lichenihabitans psoromatis TaxID=2528642 RepID=UPI001FDEA39D|nr:hypothetical protein [Lichenihabitans psoromatis]